MRVLIVVDMQNDFITGSLGTLEAEAIVRRVKDKIACFEGTVFFTKDTHEANYLETQEGHHLPIAHCIRGTEGWKLHPALAAFSAEIIEKGTFGSVQLAERLMRMPDLESIELIGLCTDICVISNALLLKAYLPEIPIRVDGSCCAGASPEGHANALKAMRACQIEITG